MCVCVCVYVCVCIKYLFEALALHRRLSRLFVCFLTALLLHYLWITTTAGAGAWQELVNKINWPAKSAAVGAYLSMRESRSLAHASYAYACILHMHTAVGAYLSMR